MHGDQFEGMLSIRRCSTHAMYLVRNHTLGSISTSLHTHPFAHTFRKSHAIPAIRVKPLASLRFLKTYCNASCIQHALQIGPHHLRLTIELILMYVLMSLVAIFLRLPMVQPKIFIGVFLQEC